jgi:hypothetical protein
MLQIVIPATELWDEGKQEFVYTKEQTLQLEHSLVSVAKWESKWHKPFLSKNEKTEEETLDYIRCMTLTQNVNPEVYSRLSQENFKQINAYIENPMTATSFSEDRTGKTNREVITAEIIYHWMIALNIPPDYHKWHLNRLLTLIRVCNIKNQPPKKMSKRDALSRNAALNAARRKQYNTKG